MLCTRFIQSVPWNARDEHNQFIDINWHKPLFVYQANCQQFSVSLADPLLQSAAHLISSAHPQLLSPLILQHRKSDVAPTTQPQISDSHETLFHTVKPLKKLLGLGFQYLCHL